jgi:hypothetical protein
MTAQKENTTISGEVGEEQLSKWLFESNSPIWVITIDKKRCYIKKPSTEKMLSITNAGYSPGQVKILMALLFVGGDETVLISDETSTRATDIFVDMIKNQDNKVQN